MPITVRELQRLPIGALATVSRDYEGDGRTDLVRIMKGPRERDGEYGPRESTEIYVRYIKNERDQKGHGWDPLTAVTLVTVVTEDFD